MSENLAAMTTTATRNDALTVDRVVVNYEEPIRYGDESELELTVLMPCLNESETLAICIRKALNFMEANQILGEVVVSDNGSTDGSQEIARRSGARVVDVPIRGYGAALIYGGSSARGKY